MKNMKILKIREHRSTGVTLEWGSFSEEGKLNETLKQDLDWLRKEKSELCMLDLIQSSASSSSSDSSTVFIFHIGTLKFNKVKYIPRSLT